MSSTALADHDVAPRAGGVRRLFVAWQDPEIRSITPSRASPASETATATPSSSIPASSPATPALSAICRIPSLHECYARRPLSILREPHHAPHPRRLRRLLGMLGLSSMPTRSRSLPAAKGDVPPIPSKSSPSEPPRWHCDLPVPLHGVRHVPIATIYRRPEHDRCALCPARPPE